MGILKEIVVVVVAYTEEIVFACARQKDCFEMAVNRRDQDKECGNLVFLLGMYVLIPPRRGLEVCTLEIVRNLQDFSPRHYKGRNILLVKDHEEVTLHLSRYKTAKFTGHEEIRLKVTHIIRMTKITFVDTRGILQLRDFCLPTVDVIYQDRTFFFLNCLLLW